jgi:hypothetical protein
MKLDRKLNKEEYVKYVTISEYAWGCVPVDVNWAIKTTLYDEMEAKLISSGLVNIKPKLVLIEKK